MPYVNALHAVIIIYTYYIVYVGKQPLILVTNLNFSLFPVEWLHVVSGYVQIDCVYIYNW